METVEQDYILFVDTWPCTKHTKYGQERYIQTLGQWLFLGSQEGKGVGGGR